MAQYPPAAYYPPPAPPPPQPPAPPKKKGCCSCCLWVLLLLFVLAAGFVAFAYFYLQPPVNPVEEEYEEIPDYFPAQRMELNRIVVLAEPTSMSSPGEASHG